MKREEQGFAMYVKPLMKLWIAWVISNVFQCNKINETTHLE
jgi:hypothetical protein